MFISGYKKQLAVMKKCGAGECATTSDRAAAHVPHVSLCVCVCLHQTFAPTSSGQRSARKGSNVQRSVDVDRTRAALLALEVAMQHRFWGESRKRISSFLYANAAPLPASRSASYTHFRTRIRVHLFSASICRATTRRVEAERRCEAGSW